MKDDKVETCENCASWDDGCCIIQNWVPKSAEDWCRKFHSIKTCGDCDSFRYDAIGGTMGKCATSYLSQGWTKEDTYINDCKRFIPKQKTCPECGNKFSGDACDICGENQQAMREPVKCGLCGHVALYHIAQDQETVKCPDCGSFIKVDNPKMIAIETEDNAESGLAEKHWQWVSGLIKAILEDNPPTEAWQKALTFDNRTLEYIYTTAFEHGYKHGRDDAKADVQPRKGDENES
jgi:hypothetical protein